MLGGIHVTAWMIGAAHTLLRFNVATFGAGHSDHAGPMALGGASAHRITTGAGRSWNGVLTRKSVSHVAIRCLWILAGYAVGSDPET
jgi:hypothetical protein